MAGFCSSTEPCQLTPEHWCQKKKGGSMGRCTNPRKAWQYIDPKMPRKLQWRQNTNPAVPTRGFTLPCEQCLSCRLANAQNNATRAIHEAEEHDESCFITLTYDTPHLPTTESGIPTLVKKDFQDFAKRLRKRLALFDIEIRILYCGEYGEQRGRPHYHAIIFGWTPGDLYPVERSHSGKEQFSSKCLEKAWSDDKGLIGRVRVAPFHPDLASYVARYVTKKQKGPKRHQRDDRLSEFAQGPKGKKGGLGRPWLEKYWTDVFPHNVCIIAGKKRPVPRYYLKVMEQLDPGRAQVYKAERLANVGEPEHPEDAKRRDKFLKEKFKLLKRELEL